MNQTLLTRPWIQLVMTMMVTACVSKLPDPEVGECREDTDCPSPMVCVADKEGELGICGCEPSASGCFGGPDRGDCVCASGDDAECTCPDQVECTTSEDCPGSMACQEGRCTCAPGGSAIVDACPDGLRCAPVGSSDFRCVCDAIAGKSTPPISLECPGEQWCGNDSRCGCAVDAQCPGQLRCVPDAHGVGRCECDDTAGAVCMLPVSCDGDEVCGEDAFCCELDVDCPGDETRVCIGASGACTCEDGRCVSEATVSGLCDLSGAVERNACGGRRPLRPQDAEPGAACGHQSWGQWTCAGCEQPMQCCVGAVSSTACCDPAESVTTCDPQTRGAQVCCDPQTHLPDACGNCVLLDSPAAKSSGRAPGDPCSAPGGAGDEAGGSRTGRWLCDSFRLQAVCRVCPNAADEPNACGGCAILELPDLPNPIPNETPCTAGGGASRGCEGVVVCDGPDALRCEPRVRNRCGGCGPVYVLTGGSPDSDRAPCAVEDGHRLLPSDDAASRAECTCALDATDGSATVDRCRDTGQILATPVATIDDLIDGALCGECGAYDCWRSADGAQWLVCEDSGANSCGGCAQPLVVRGGRALGDTAIRGGECRSTGLSTDGRLDCGADGDTLICTEVFENDCGGDEALEHRDGAPCDPGGGRCAGQWRCDGHNAVECVAGRPNACGGCGELGDSPACDRPVCTADLNAKVCLEDRDSDGHSICVFRNGVRSDCEIADPGRGPTDDTDDEDPCEPGPSQDPSCVCGREGGECCPGSRCNPRCVVEGSVHCNESASPIECHGNRCVPCGEIGGRCCQNEFRSCPGDDSYCDGNDICVQRGELGAQCLDGECNGDDLACVEDLCEPCGSAGQYCCGDECPGDDLFCDQPLGNPPPGEGLCRPCGRLGTRCCPGDICDEGHCLMNYCLAPETSQAVPGGRCGELGQCDASEMPAVCTRDSDEFVCLRCGGPGLVPCDDLLTESRVP